MLLREVPCHKYLMFNPSLPSRSVIFFSLVSNAFTSLGLMTYSTFLIFPLGRKSNRSSTRLKCPSLSSVLRIVTRLIGPSLFALGVDPDEPPVELGVDPDRPPLEFGVDLDGPPVLCCLHI